MITDEEINKVLEEKEIDFVTKAIENLGYEPNCHIIPSTFVSGFLERMYIDFLIENYQYNYNQMVIFYKKLNKEVVIVVDTPNRELLINQLKRYFKMKAFL